MELWSVCIEETVYWTELANQTIYYIVSNIYLISMAHVTKCPFILRWANGLYFLVHFHFLQVGVFRFSLVDQDTRPSPPFYKSNTSLAKIGFRSSHQGVVKVFECHAPAKVVLVVPTKVILLVGGHKVVLIDANHGDTGGGQQSR